MMSSLRHVAAGAEGQRELYAELGNRPMVGTSLSHAHPVQLFE